MTDRPHRRFAIRALLASFAAFGYSGIAAAESCGPEPSDYVEAMTGIRVHECGFAPLTAALYEKHGDSPDLQEKLEETVNTSKEDVAVRMLCVWALSETSEGRSKLKSFIDQPHVGPDEDEIRVLGAALHYVGRFIDPSTIKFLSERATLDYWQSRPDFHVENPDPTARPVYRLRDTALLGLSIDPTPEAYEALERLISGECADMSPILLANTLKESKRNLESKSQL